MTVDELRTKLKAIGQEHVLRFWNDLDAAGRERLSSQVASLNLEAIPNLVQHYVQRDEGHQVPHDLEPISPLPREPHTAEQRALYDRAREHGRGLLAAGHVGAFVVAGGQGSRLGFEGPKGAFGVTPLLSKPLFQVFAEQLQAHGRDAGRVIPWYIMTSDANDAATRAFFTEHKYFGCDPSAVFFFQQGMMPAFSTDGRLLLAAKDSLALSPDGHGGALRALKQSGALDDMRRRGVEHLSYWQVDNPIVHVVDPLFLGLHDLTGSEMSSKTISKSDDFEKVGNFCISGGRLTVIEYSDLPAKLAVARDAEGNRQFDAGSIAIHALRVSFIERLNAGGDLQLPWHRASKKVAHLDESGKLIKPDKPNAVKLEQFVFDAVPLAANPLVYTTDRSEEFSPVKNAEGGDSPATSRRDQIRRHARWLRAVGIEVPYKGEEVDAVIEISPLYAATFDQLKAKKPAISAVRPGSKLYIGPEGVKEM